MMPYFQLPSLSFLRRRKNGSNLEALFLHSGNGKKRIEILRYNNLARSKYESIDKEFICFGEPQSDKALADLISNLDSLYDDVHVF